MTYGTLANAQTGAPSREDGWLIAQRSSAYTLGTTYYLASGSQPTVRTLCRLTAAREAAAHRLSAARHTVGLGHAEVRHWQSWYRHTTLALMADAWRGVTQRTVHHAR
jgi:SRSO17 transposase